MQVVFISLTINSLETKARFKNLHYNSTERERENRDRSDRNMTKNRRQGDRVTGDRETDGR
jgi:hypothetical protein